jgi:hypothetical protein
MRTNARVGLPQLSEASFKVLHDIPKFQSQTRNSEPEK